MTLLTFKLLDATRERAAWRWEAEQARPGDYLVGETESHMNHNLYFKKVKLKETFKESPYVLRCVDFTLVDTHQ